MAEGESLNQKASTAQGGQITANNPTGTKLGAASEGKILT